MELLYFFESVRTPVLDFLMSAITTLGEESVFIVLAIVTFWCISKRAGYTFMITGLLGTAVNQFLKIMFRIPRPWVLDPSFTIVEAARQNATGYSFPSGHTQSAVGLFSLSFLMSDKRSVKILSAAAVLLVPISRMYLGVHTPLDVGVSFVLAVLLAVIFYFTVYKSQNTKALEICIFIYLAVSVLALSVVLLINFPKDIDLSLLEDAVNNLSKLVGAAIGVVLVYYADKKYIKFETKAPILVQLVKVILGLIIVLLIKSLLKTPLNLAFGKYVGSAVRYFLLITVAGAVWPLSFKPLCDFYNKKFNK